MLSDSEIHAALKTDQISIIPFNRDFLGPNSYDLRLDPNYRLLEDDEDPIDVTERVPSSVLLSVEDREIPHEIIIPGRRTIVVMTMERIIVKPPIAGILSPRSGFARLPLSLGYSQLVDTGYDGVCGMTITNLTARKFILHGRQRFMQIMFHYAGPIKREYAKKPYVKYLNNDGSDVPQYKIDREWIKPQS